MALQSWLSLESSVASLARWLPQPFPDLQGLYHLTAGGGPLHRFFFAYGIWESMMISREERRNGVALEMLVEELGSAMEEVFRVPRRSQACQIRLQQRAA